MATHSAPAPWYRYLRLLRPEVADLGTIALYGVGGAVLALAVPLTVDALISSIAFGTLLTPLVVLVGILIGCLVLLGTMRALQAWVAEVIERRIFVRIAGDLAWRLPRVALATFDRHHGPELVNRFFDTVTVQKSSSKLLLVVTDVALTGGVGMLVLAFYHPFLLLFVALLAVAIAFVVLVLGIGGVRTAVGESAAKYGVAAWLQELARHPTAFADRSGAAFAERRTDALCADYVRARRLHFRVVFRQICGALVLQVVASAALLGLGGFLVIDQQLTPGQLVASELIVAAVVANIAKLGAVLEDWYDVCAAADKLGHLLDLPLERQHGAAPPTPTMGLGIELRGVVLADGDAPFDLSVAPGERIAVLDADGGAARRLFDAVCGHREPVRGHVAVAGVDLRQLQLHTAREHIALVRGHELVAGSVLDNLRLGSDDLDPDPDAVRRVLDDVGLWAEVVALPHGLDSELASGGHPLTPGQARRLVLARALLRAPRLLLLDGALDGLSPAVRQHVLDRVFARGRECTVLVATTQPDVAATCDRSIELHCPIPTAGAAGGPTP